jgi:apolipoprotein N-acyltransferase
MEVMKAILLSILSGLLLTAGFPKPAMFYVSWVALLPLLYAIEGKTGKQALALGCICGLVHSCTCLLWIHYAIYHFGGFSVLMSLLFLVVLCFSMSVYATAFALVAQRWQSMPLLYVFGLPFVWVALEWGRAFAISGFPWANMGYTQTPINTLIQFADITGVYGVSWLVVFGNTVIYGLFRNYAGKSGVAVLVVCMVAAPAYGFWRTGQISALQDRSTSINVGVIQGNIDQGQKWDPVFALETVSDAPKVTRCLISSCGPNPRCLSFTALMRT